MAVGGTPDVAAGDSLEGMVLKSVEGIVLQAVQGMQLGMLLGMLQPQLGKPQRRCCMEAGVPVEECSLGGTPPSPVGGSPPHPWWW